MGRVRHFLFASNEDTRRAIASADMVRGTEQTIAVMFLLLRSVTVVGLVSGSVAARSGGVTHGAYWVVTVACLALSVAFMLDVTSRRALHARPWGPWDLALAVVALVVLPRCLDDGLLLGHWLNWSSGLAQNVATSAGAWLRSRRRALGVGLALAVVYVAGVWPQWAADPATVTLEAFLLPTFALSTAFFQGLVRGMAGLVEDSKTAAVSAAKEQELDRYRHMVHDAAGILRQLGDEATPAVLLPALRRQALDEARRMRSYLSDRGIADPSVVTPEETSLAVVVESATRGFEDLPLEVSVDLARDARLPYGDALALQRAVVTILHNVRRHARAQEVIIHADAVGPEWELVVRDDGRGFDAATTPLGFGLGRQVIDELQRRGMQPSVRSRPGDGTLVAICGRTAP